MNTPRKLSRLASLRFLVVITLATMPAINGYSDTMVITDSLSAPTTNLQLSVLPDTDSTQGNLGFGSGRSLLQTFTAASSFTLDAITLYVPFAATASNADITLTLNIYPNNWDYTASPTATVLTVSGTTPASIASNSYLTFDIPDIALTSGTVYGFVLSSLSSGSINFEYSNPNAAYPGGVLAIDKGDGNGFTGPNGDLAPFYIQGTAAIPEPASYAFLAATVAFGCVVLTVCKRKTRLRS